MSKPLDFAEFYKLLKNVKVKANTSKVKLDTLVMDYTSGNSAESSFEELGQYFCALAIEELCNYVHINDLHMLLNLDQSVWDYLFIRNGTNISNHLLSSLKKRSQEDKVLFKISEKWNIPYDQLEENFLDLSKYVVEGILALIN